MLHEPAGPSAPDYASDAKMRIGVWMFLLYAVVYGGFVALNVIHPASMEARIVFGLNLAVVYGFGLIGFALFLALIYNHLCVREEIAAARRHADRGKDA